jgi:NAD(P)-dependent dehydrogenase (short-subunit alcohol dehydrogenase family)
MKRKPGRLRGKVALVTGGDRGIGLAIAKALAEEGCDLAISGRNESALKRSVKELDHAPRVVAVVSDVRDPDEVQAMIAAVKRRFGRLDLLINNAGVGHENFSVAKLPLKIWKDVIDTNLTGMFLVTQAALPLMKRGGAIVNNLSIAAKRVFPGVSAYSASKHGALGFTNTLREELREKGIRVIALLPGPTDTAIWNSLWPEAPKKKMMSAATVAQAVVEALCLSDEATMEEMVILPKAGTL